MYYPNTYGKTTEFNPVYTVEGCTFDRNSATYDVKNGDDAGGGAILIQVNPVSKPDTTQWAKLYVKGSTFTGNTATGFGGAISTRREAGQRQRLYLHKCGWAAPLTETVLPRQATAVGAAVVLCG